MFTIAASNPFASPVIAKDSEGVTTANYGLEVLIKLWIEDINSEQSIYGINHKFLANTRVVSLIRAVLVLLGLTVGEVYANFWAPPSN